MNKIINFQAENIKKIKAIEITPEGNMVILSGRNAQGKTTVLDCILWALEGKTNIQEKPIREGENKGNIVLELEDIIITRKFKLDDGERVTTALEVVNKDGCKFASPQTILDKLLGSLSLDPLAFMRMKAKEQREFLLKTINLSIDLDEVENNKKSFYDRRTIVNREINRLEGAISEIIVPKDTPDVETNVSELVQILSVMEKENNEFDEKQVYIEGTKKKINEALNNLSDLRESLLNAEDLLSAKKLHSDEEISEIKEKISKSAEINKNVYNKGQKENLEKDLKELKRTSNSHTTSIDNLNKEKDHALRNAKMPVAGLSIGEEELLFNNIPISQISDAEKLRLSCSIAMGSESSLRVLRIKEGSNLDSEGLKILAEMAGEKDYQIWLEKVDESGKMGIVIEEGEIVTINKN